jgi:hypothetical protein
MRHPPPHDPVREEPGHHLRPRSSVTGRFREMIAATPPEARRPAELRGVDGGIGTTAPRPWSRRSRSPVASPGRTRVAAGDGGTARPGSGSMAH